MIELGFEVDIALPKGSALRGLVTVEGIFMQLVRSRPAGCHIGGCFYRSIICIGICLLMIAHPYFAKTMPMSELARSAMNKGMFRTPLSNFRLFKEKRTLSFVSSGYVSAYFFRLVLLMFVSALTSMGMMSFWRWMTKSTSHGGLVRDQ